MVAALKDIGPIERALTLGDRVDAHLRQLLIGGRLAPGEKLSLRAVGLALGVSMMPAREAVSRLVAEHALEVAPNRTVRVPVMTLSHFRELTRVRIVVEGYAAAEAAQKAGKIALDTIAQYDTAFRRESEKHTPDLALAVALNKDLHFSVYAAADMPVLMQIIERLWLQIGPVLNLDLRGSPTRLREGAAKSWHRELVAGLADKNPERARAAIEGDITSAATAIESRGILVVESDTSWT
ncbi:MAG: GntR family transcriptional regulator [Beijerinckiaceae bacterium]